MSNITYLTFGILVGFLIGFNIQPDSAEEQPAPPPSTIQFEKDVPLLICKMEINTCKMEASATGINYIAERMRGD